MLEREKVIKGLNCCCRTNGSNCAKCPYNITNSDCTALMSMDVLALLKEQEHSETFIVIDNKTGKEADTYDIALHEDWAKHLCYCDMDGWAIEEDGTLLLVDECGQFAYADRERFKVKWE